MSRGSAAGASSSGAATSSSSAVDFYTKLAFSVIGIYTCVAGSLAAARRSRRSSQRRCLRGGARLEELTVQDFPFLAKSVPYDGPTMEAAANTIWTRHQASRAALADIEDKRRLNKSVVAASQTVSEARAAFDAATW